MQKVAQVKVGGWWVGTDATNRCLHIFFHYPCHCLISTHSIHHHHHFLLIAQVILSFHPVHQSFHPHPFFRHIFASNHKMAKVFHLPISTFLTHPILSSHSMPSCERTRTQSKHQHPVTFPTVDHSLFARGLISRSADLPTASAPGTSSARHSAVTASRFISPSPFELV